MKGWTCWMRRCERILVVQALSSSSKSSLSSSTSKIRVCQNKHCMKKYPQLHQTLSILVNQPVEVSGCLSHCEKGPNVQLQGGCGGGASPTSVGDNNDPTGSVLLHGMVNVATVVDQLEQQQEEEQRNNNDNTSWSIPKLRIAACNVMDKATSRLLQRGMLCWNFLLLLPSWHKKRVYNNIRCVRMCVCVCAGCVLSKVVLFSRPHCMLCCCVSI